MRVVLPAAGMLRRGSCRGRRGATNRDHGRQAVQIARRRAGGDPRGVTGTQARCSGGFAQRRARCFMCRRMDHGRRPVTKSAANPHECSILEPRLRCAPKCAKGARNRQMKLNSVYARNLKTLTSMRMDSDYRVTQAGRALLAHKEVPARQQGKAPQRSGSIEGRPQTTHRRH